MKPKLPVRPIKFMTNLRVEENKQEIYNGYMVAEEEYDVINMLLICKWELFCLLLNS